MVQKDNELKIKQNLKDAGFEEKNISEYMACHRNGQNELEVKMLRKQRDHLLDEIHEKQKCIDCLDYLLYQIRKNG